MIEKAWAVKPLAFFGFRQLCEKKGVFGINKPFTQQIKILPQRFSYLTR